MTPIREIERQEQEELARVAAAAAAVSPPHLSSLPFLPSSIFAITLRIHNCLRVIDYCQRTSR